MKFLCIGLTALALFTTLVAAGAEANWHPADGPLMTRWAKLVSPTNALPEYPRPQMVRPDWQSLNGLWDYAITDKNTTTPANYDGKILVPFPIESALLGVMKAFLPSQRLWYHRTFSVPESWQGKHLLLHFGAVDWDTEVFVNGRSVGTHRGGMTPSILTSRIRLRQRDRKRLSSPCWIQAIQVGSYEVSRRCIRVAQPIPPVRGYGRRSG